MAQWVFSSSWFIHNNFYYGSSAICLTLSTHTHTKRRRGCLGALKWGLSHVDIARGSGPFHSVHLLDQMYPASIFPFVVIVAFSRCSSIFFIFFILHISVLFVLFMGS